MWPVADQIVVYARMSPDGKERIVRALKDRGVSTLMCGDGGNDVGALKTADVGVSLMCGFGNANVEKEGEGKESASGTKVAGEEELAALTKGQEVKRAELQRKHAAELKVKRAEMQSKQKAYVQEEVQKLIAAGEGAFSAQFKAMKTVTARLNREMQAEQQLLAKKYALTCACALNS